MKVYHNNEWISLESTDRIDIESYFQKYTPSEVSIDNKDIKSVTIDGNKIWEKVTEITEGFESSFSSDWDTPNFYNNKSPAFEGSSSAGSRSNGGIDATWTPLDSPTEIEEFEYKWWETSNQTGHVVILEDENGNEIMESGNENPQWYLNNGSGGRYQVYGGDNYQEWTYFKFTFDWTNGEYDYRLEDTSSGTVKTGTEQMDNNNPVDRIRFTGSGYGSADDVVFDDLRIKP